MNAGQSANSDQEIHRGAGIAGNDGVADKQTGKSKSGSTVGGERVDRSQQSSLKGNLPPAPNKSESNENSANDSDSEPAKQAGTIEDESAVAKEIKLPPPAEPTGETGTEPGDTIMEIVGEDMDGQDFALSDYEGKVIMLDFWGDW